jgi:hypothetical protein
MSYRRHDSCHIGDMTHVLSVLHNITPQTHNNTIPRRHDSCHTGDMTHVLSVLHNITPQTHNNTIPVCIYAYHMRHIDMCAHGHIYRRLHHACYLPPHYYSLLTLRHIDLCAHGHIYRVLGIVIMPVIYHHITTTLLTLLVQESLAVADTTPTHTSTMH